MKTAAAGRGPDHASALSMDLRRPAHWELPCSLPAGSFRLQGARRGPGHCPNQDIAWGSEPSGHKIHTGETGVPGT